MTNDRGMVNLQTAFYWECTCGYGAFGLPPKANLDEDEAEEAYRKLHDLEIWSELPEDWRSFKMVYLPLVVKCEECGAEFNTREEDDEVT